MINLGIVRPGSTIYIPFETFGNASPVPITITGLATSDVKVYKNGSVTERASASGFTLLDTDGIDFDGLTGIHGVSIDLSDNTTASFWTAGAKYFVVIGDITVDSLTMRFIPVTFEIGYAGSLIDTTIATLASQTSFTLTSGPAEDDALNGSIVVIHDIASAVQIGQAAISDYTGATKTVTLAVATSFTAAAGDNISVMPRTNLYSVNGAPASAGGTVDANVVSLGSDTQSLADLKDFADAGYDPATNKVQGVVLVDTTTTNTDMRGTDSAALASVWSSTLASSLSPIRSSTAQAGATTTITLDASASAVADFYRPCGIYLTGGTGAGQFRIIDNYDGTTKVATVSESWYITPDNTTTFAIRPEGVAHVDAKAIDGNELSAGYLKSLADQYGTAGYTNAAVVTIANNAITAAAIAADAIVELQAGMATQSSVNAIDDLLDTEMPALTAAVAAEAIKTAAIKAKTDNLPTDPADQSAVEAAITAATSPLATQTSVNIIDDLLDTEIAALTTQLGLVKDRVSYCLTVLVGACADAGTATETYVYTIGGETFTADYTGLDATGNRSTTTLSKV